MRKSNNKLKHEGLSDSVKYLVAIDYYKGK